MKFRYLCRLIAESHYLDKCVGEPYIWVSITDPGTSKPKLNGNNCKGIISKSFYDIDKVIELPNGKAEPLSEKDAKDIVDFVRENKTKVNVVLVHCEAGISRSSGIAFGLKAIFGGEVESIPEGGFSLANKHVMRRIEEAGGLRNDGSNFKKG